MQSHRYVVIRTPLSLRPWQIIAVSETDFYVHGNFKSLASARSKANALNETSANPVISELAEANRLLDIVDVSGTTEALWLLFEKGAKVPVGRRTRARFKQTAKSHWAG